MSKEYDIGSKWTHTLKTRAFKHYRIAGRRYSPEGELELEIMAVLDRSHRFWIKKRIFVEADWKQGWEE